MRKLPIALIALASAVVACSSSRDDVLGGASQDLVSDIASMVQRPDGNFDVTCKDGSREIATPAQITENRVCRSPGSPPAGVIIYDPSDSCATGNAVARVTASTNCASLPTTRASSVSVNGQCTDLVPDSTIQKACMAFQPGAITIFDPSDSCDSSQAVASVNGATDCSALSTARASSIRVDGRCIDLVPDSTIRAACMAYQPNRLVIFDPSDSCSPGNAVASVGVDTDCNTLSTARASSIMIDGQCTDLVPDSTIRQACLIYHP